MIVVAIIGILAAIAMPAYQDYTVRSKVTEGLNLAAASKLAVTETWAANGKFPASNQEAGLPDANTIKEADLAKLPHMNAALAKAVVSKRPFKTIKDPTLKKGKRKVETTGTPPLATSVERKVYDADGKLLYDDTWRSSYVGEPTIVRVGTKKPPKPKPAQNAANRGGPPVASEAPVGTSSETAPPVNPVTPP
jgi:Tfp pilus assembly major pilin PilA